MPFLSIILIVCSFLFLMPVISCHLKFTCHIFKLKFIPFPLKPIVHENDRERENEQSMGNLRIYDNRTEYLWCFIIWNFWLSVEFWFSIRLTHRLIEWNFCFCQTAISSYVNRRPVLINLKNTVQQINLYQIIGIMLWVLFAICDIASDLVSWT